MISWLFPSVSGQADDKSIVGLLVDLPKASSLQDDDEEHSAQKDGRAGKGPVRNVWEEGQDSDDGGRTASKRRRGGFDSLTRGPVGQTGPHKASVTRWTRPPASVSRRALEESRAF